MIDLDGFKAINDRYGHMPGDAVLSAVADQLHRMLRQSDVRCRLGGDEFLVILPDTPIDDAIRVAESVRSAIEALEIQSARGPIAITASIGVAASAAACRRSTSPASSIGPTSRSTAPRKPAGTACRPARRRPAAPRPV